MANDLTVWNAAKDVSTALTTIITNYRSLRAVRKCDTALLDERIAVFKAAARARGAGQLVRTNIDEISKTCQYIEQQNLSPVGQQMAMNQLIELGSLLSDNLNRYRSA